MTLRIAPDSLKVEHLRETLGVGVASPRISWRVETDTPSWMQAAYEVEASGDDGGSGSTTGRVESEASVLVPWGGPALVSRQRLQVRVRAWGQDGLGSEWSEPLVVEAGLLEPNDWSAQFVTPDWDEDTSIMLPGPLLRREFDVRADAVSARLYASALGLYEAQINGQVVGDHVMSPGWTSYEHRLRYQVFDVLPLLREGKNAIGAMLADGWYRGQFSVPVAGGRNLYGDRTALLAQLEVTYADDTCEVIASGLDWRATEGPIRTSGIYEGETHDARLEPVGWSSAGFDDRAWSGVRVIERDMATLVAASGPPVRRQEILAPVEVTTSPSGKTILDFGQNFAGRLRFGVEGPAGTTVTFRHAELLQDGELCTRPLRTAIATDRYTLRGDGVEMWEPRFTFHGFRYAEITGWPGKFSPDAVRAVVTHSDLERTGWFECSDDLVNRLHENAVWSMKSNFLDVPTDCPQRDERLGWTGDLTVFSPSACFLHDSAGFLDNWLADLAADQTEDGTVPIVIPDTFGRSPNGARIGWAQTAQAVWGDAAVIVPWVLYQRYGDAQILERQFDSMQAWVDRITEIAGLTRLWNKGFQLADWLDPAAPPTEPARAMTDPHLVSTAYFAHVSDLLSCAAETIGRNQERDRYRALSDEVAAAFRREFVTPSGRMASDTQTAYALALMFDLLETDEQRERAGRRLSSLVRFNKHRVGTGFVGTAIVTDALTQAGDVEVAYRMLLEKECPSWLYPVTMGATTVWERWDSLLPDGTVNPGEMTSFNHYALGAVADWLHRVVGGLATLTPGYKTFEVRPQPGGGMEHASARHRTPYGEASSSWRMEDGRLEVDVVVPPNTTARIVAPSGEGAEEVGSGSHHRTFAIG